MPLEKFALEDFENNKIETLYTTMYLYKGLLMSGREKHIYNYIQSKAEYKEYFDTIVLKYFKENSEGNFLIDFAKKEVRKENSLFTFEKIGS